MNHQTLLGLILATTAVGAFRGAASQDEALYSGPQPGEPIVGFEVVAATGAERDTVVDYVERFDGAPTVYCFVHQVSRASSRTIRALDQACAERADEGLEALFVMLGADQDQIERYGLQLPEILELDSKVAISVDGQEGPGAWGLDRELVLTVTVVDEDTTVASFPLLSTNETDVPRIMEVVDGLLVELDTLEDLRGAVLDLRADVRELKSQVAALSAAVGAPTPAAGGRGSMRGGAMGAGGPDSRDSMQPGGAQRGAGQAMRPDAEGRPLESELRAVLEPGLDDVSVAARVQGLRARLERQPAERARFVQLVGDAPRPAPGTEYAHRLLTELARGLAAADGDDRR